MVSFYPRIALKTRESQLAGIGTESEKKFLQIRKVFATSSLLAEEYPNILKMYEYYTKYPDNMQSVRMNWKVSG